jgi:hypothetical protein
VTRYVDWLGVAFIAYGALELVAVLMLFLLALGMGGGLGSLGLSSGDTELLIIGGFYGGILGFAALFELLFAVPKLLVGTALRRRAPWSRLGGLVMGCVGLMNIPLGTALGLFAIVVLIDKDVQAEFEA